MFSYVVGEEYHGQYEGCVGAYCYHTQVQHGTLEDAKNFLQYVQRQRESAGKVYKIFKLVEVKNDED